MKANLINIVFCVLGLLFFSCNQVNNYDNVNAQDSTTKNKNYESHMNSPVDSKQDQNSISDSSSLSDCNIDIVVEIFQNIDTISEKKIESFLEILKKDCSSNAEFSEFSNKVLFLLVDKRTKETLSLLSSNKKLDIEYILFMFSNPIDDSIPIKSIIEKIKKAECDEKLKGRIMGALKG